MLAGKGLTVTRTRTHARTHACTHACTHTRAHTHAYTHAYAQHTRPRTHTRTYVHIHVYTHSLTHAYTSSQVGVAGALTMVMSMAGHAGQSAAWAGCTAGAATARAPPALSTPPSRYLQPETMFSCKNKHLSARCSALALTTCLSQWNLHDLESLQPLVASSLHSERYSPGPSGF